MPKKVILIAAASFLATATLVAATKIHHGNTIKTAAPKEKKADYTHERTHCFD